MVKLQKITDNSWLVVSKSELPVKIGLLSKQKDKFILLAQNAKTEFENQNEISDFFSENVFEHEEAKSESYRDLKVYVNGYPTKFDVAHETELPLVSQYRNVRDLPVFTKKKGSKMYYAAGYYAIDFGQYSWSPFHCPRVDTITKYDTVGPFKTEEELKESIDLLKMDVRDGSQKTKIIPRSRKHQ